MWLSLDPSSTTVGYAAWDGDNLLFAEALSVPSSASGKRAIFGVAHPTHWVRLKWLFDSMHTRFGHAQLDEVVLEEPFSAPHQNGRVMYNAVGLWYGWGLRYTPDVYLHSASSIKKFLLPSLAPKDRHKEAAFAEVSSHYDVKSFDAADAIAVGMYHLSLME